MNYHDWERFDAYFKSTENADEYLCGCGCKTVHDWNHGFAQRIKIDLEKALGR